MEKKLPKLINFILPSGHSIASLTHIARTVCRRTERRLVQLIDLSKSENIHLKYLNRLSDFLFVLSRFIIIINDDKEIIWEKKPLKDSIIEEKIYFCKKNLMYWTLELASKLEDAPWPATKDELIDFAIRSGAPMEVVENLQELTEDEPGMQWETIEDIWPDYPTKDDFFFNEDEY